MFDDATAAAEAALAAGAHYADARVVVSRHQGLEALNGVIEALDQGESAGVGVRALIGSSWGFFATADPAFARQAGEQAAAIARASASVPGPAMPLADVPVAEDDFETPHDEDPLAVSLAERGDLVVGVTEAMRAVPGVALARAFLSAWDTEKWFVSSQGHRLHQHLVETGGGMDATAVGESETQRRSYPQAFGQFETGGYEVVRRWDLPGHADQVASEAVAILTADECPSGTTDLILESSQLALQIHESVGHAIELDRILG
ncbi:MAG: PmbA/TldA family metallopeptidase, partial [Acidimicrobiia bacterium]